MLLWKKNKNTGAWGEDEAAKYLQKEGYTKNALYSAAEAVTPAKQQKIYLTALNYLEEYNCELQPRFDVCEVYPTEIKRKRVAEINYLEDAFQVVSH